jgi:hypothetical protein
MLGNGAGTDEKVLGQTFNHRHQLFRYHHPAQSPFELLLMTA